MKWRTIGGRLRFPKTQYHLLPDTALWRRWVAAMARIARVAPTACRKPRATSHERRAASHESRMPAPDSPIPNPESRFPAVGRRLPFWQFPRPAACPPLAGPSVPQSLSPSVPFLLHFPPIGTEIVHNGVCPSVHVTNHQIRVKIDQKGDVFRQKGIKKARISSCPS